MWGTRQDVTATNVSRGKQAQLDVQLQQVRDEGVGSFIFMLFRHTQAHNRRQIAPHLLQQVQLQQVRGAGGHT